MLMGWIRWPKKKEMDGSASQHRRESAPARTLQHFDLNKSRDEAYNKAFSKFNEWRVNERKQMLSNQRNNDRHDVDANEDNGNMAGSGQFKSVPNRVPIVPSSELDDGSTIIAGGDGVNSYSSSQTTDLFVPMQPKKRELIYDGKIPRHSLPANMHKIKKKRAKHPQRETSTIHEDEVKEFEVSHCSRNSDGGNGARTPFNSPPTKFYKQNSNPYATSLTHSNNLSDGISDGTSSQVSSIRICPEKPKRIMLQQQNTSQLTKELSGAHFSGAYKNYEIHSPFFGAAASSDRCNGRLMIAAGVRAAALPSSSSNDTGDERNTKLKRNSASSQYHVILNKHGDPVEYALPFVEQQQQQQHSNGGAFAAIGNDDKHHATDAPNYDDEIFNEDPRQCEQIVGRMFNDSDADDDDDNDETEIVYRRSNTTQIPAALQVTDLDKSLDSLDRKRKQYSKQIFSGVDSVPMTATAVQSQRNLLEFFKTIRGDVRVCSPNELKPKQTVLRNTFASPMEFISGTYRKSTVTLRNCSPADMDDGENDDGRFIAESVLRRDLEILKKIRHGDIINLMAISCNADFNEITLVLEPADYTLHYFLHQMKKEVSIIDAISIVQQIASATLYLQECGYIHSNISSHSVLMRKCPHLVKLTSFELATDIAPGTKMEIERKYKRNSKVISLGDGDTVDGGSNNTKSPKRPNIEGTLKERYRSASELATNGSSTHSYSTNTFRDLDVKFLPYCVDYRQQLAVYNYQPPELLINGERFVFPTEGSDVYSLTLVLWELLNNCVPFVLYEPDELKHLYATYRAHLPIFEAERCTHFKQIFKYGFELDPIIRSMSVHHLIQLLEDIKFNIRTVEPSHMAHENSLYSTAEAAKAKAVAADKSTTANYDIPKRQSAARPANNIYENTQEGRALQQKTQQSPLNNATNSTLQRSILDFNKLLSPMHGGTNANIYGRTSTLKKRKKKTPTKRSPASLRDQSAHTHADESSNFGDEFSPKLNDNILHNSVAPPKHKPSIVRNLSYENENGKELSRPIARLHTKANETSQSLIDQSPVRDANQSKTNNTSYHFTIDDYELPQHLIARNNKIRRNTWLSSDTVNMTTNSMAAHESPSNDGQLVNLLAKPSTNENYKSNKINVSIRLVTKTLSPPAKNDKNYKSDKSDTSVASNDSIAHDSSNEESPSVSTRIKFFENPGNFTIVGNKSSRRSEISFDEAVKQSHRRTQMKKLSGASPPPANKKCQLMKEINDITAEISKCWSKSRFEHFLRSHQNDTPANGVDNNNLRVGYVSPVLTSPKAIENVADKSAWQTEKDQSKRNVSILVQKLFGDEKYPDEVDAVSPNEKRNSVKETVERIEHELQIQQTPPSNNVSVIGPFRKIENKLLNEKIVNTATKSSPSPKQRTTAKRNSSNNIEQTEEMCEKVEEVMQIVGLSEYENDSGQPANIRTNDAQVASARSNQTVIKRTFYQESFISGTNMELSQLEQMFDAQSPQQTATFTSTKSSSSTTKLTTRVTLASRQFKRRLSDIGIVTLPARMSDVRHSVCGNELYDLHQQKLSQNTDTMAAGQSFERLSHRKNECRAVAASTTMLCNADRISDLLSTPRSRNILSIEDIWIDDDDYRQANYAANMKLISNSTDTLDGIDFDCISTHIVEELSESNSMITNNLQQKCIENDKSEVGSNADE